MPEQSSEPTPPPTQPLASAPSTAPSSYTSSPFALINPALAGFSRNWAAYIGLIVLLIAAGLLGFALSAVAALHGYHSALGVIFVAIIAYIALLVCAAPVFVRLRLAMARGQKTTLREALTGASSLVLPLFGTQLLVGLAVLAGLILLVIPGLIFALWFSLVPYVVINEGLSGPAALRRSRELVRHRLVDLLGVISLGLATNVLVVVPIAGPIAAAIIGLLLTPVLGIRYLQLHALKASGDGQDVPVSPLNWLAMLLALVGLGITYNADVRQIQLRDQQLQLENHAQVY